MNRRSFLKTLFPALILCWTTACSSPPKIVHEPVTGEMLFPCGNYRHEVKLTLPARTGQSERSFDFSGIVQLKPDAIRVVALSFFGTTAFKITEDRSSGEIKTEIFVDKMKKHEPQLRQYYQMLRQVLLKANTDGSVAEERPFPLGGNAELRLRAFDRNRIPTGFSIEHPSFRVDVKVVSYEI